MRAFMPMTWLLSLLLKPLVALLVLVPAYMLAELIWRWMPDGKIKRILFSPLPGHRGKRERWR